MPQSTLVSSTFQVTGLTCDHCVRAVTSAVSKIRSVTDVTVHLPTGLVVVDSDQPVDPAAVRRVIDAAGYPVV